MSNVKNIKNSNKFLVSHLVGLKLGGGWLFSNVTPFIRGFSVGSIVTVSANVALWYLLSDESRSVARVGKKIPSSDPSLEDTNQLSVLRSTLKYGEPDRGSHVRVYEGHVLSYDQARKVPYWTAELLTKETIRGSANRKHSRFQSDPDLKATFTSDNTDFLKSGWSRGHMTPAGNLKYSQRAMDDSFYLTNIVPQDFDNNSGFWNRFEMYCRDLTKQYDEVRVITGPLYLAEARQDGGKAFLSHEVIGQNAVHVPTHLYKVIIAERSNEKQKSVGAFIVPNIKLGYDKPLQNFQVTLSELESKAGLEFLPNLPSTIAVNLCSVDSCKMITKEKFQTIFLKRDLYGARSVGDLDKVWSKVVTGKLDSDATYLDAYQKRKSELEIAAVKSEL